VGYWKQAHAHIAILLYTFLILDQLNHKSFFVTFSFTWIDHPSEGEEDAIKSQKPGSHQERSEAFLSLNLGIIEFP